MSGSGEQLELPQDVIGRIASTLTKLELSGKEAISLGLISKEFSGAVQRRPLLFFDHDAIQKDAYLSCVDYGKRYKDELDYLLSTLTRYKCQNLDLEAFTFRTDPSHHSREDQNTYCQCTCLAFEKNLRRLDVSMNDDHKISTRISRLESLEQLSLSSCRLWLGGTEWKNLKRLAMEFVLMEEGMFEKILKDCPKIEDLEIRYCNWGHPKYNFRVSDLPSLKRLSIQLNRQQTFELNSLPALESLACSHGSFRDAMVDMSCSEHQNLRSLSLQFAGINEDFFTDFAGKFPKLDELSIKYNRSLKRLALSSSSIKKIELLEFEALEEAHFDVPNIVVCKYESPNNGQNTMLPSLSFSGDSGGWTSRIRLVECNANVDASVWFLELHKFLAALNRSEISISVLLKGPAFFREAQRMIADSSSDTKIIREVKEFCIETTWPEFSLASARAVLDGIFWICRPQLITFRHLSNNYSSIDTEDDPRFEHSVKYSNCDVFLEILETHANEERFSVGFNVEY